MNLIENYRRLQNQLKTELSSLNRATDSVLLLPVSKTKPASSILTLAEAGVTQFAENYAQEAQQKIQQLDRLSHLNWHFIGSLQSRKAKIIAHYFHWLHSLETLKQAKLLSKTRTQTDCPLYETPLNVCIQVNWFDESQKGGIRPNQLIEFINHIIELPNIRVRGLMFMGKAGLTSDQTAESFYHIQRLFKLAKNHLLSSASTNQYAETFDTLSMGMSQDWKLAIAHGATIIRIGTDIFGQRS